MREMRKMENNSSQDVEVVINFVLLAFIKIHNCYPSPLFLFNLLQNKQKTMSESVKENKNEDTVNNNTATEAKPVDEKQIKINNMLKDRLRKYIKKLDGKYNHCYNTDKHINKSLQQLYIYIFVVTDRLPVFVNISNEQLIKMIC